MEKDYVDRERGVKIGLKLLRQRQGYVKNLAVTLEPMPDETINYIAQANSSPPIKNLYIEKNFHNDALQGMREKSKAGVRKSSLNPMEAYGPVRGGQSRHVDYMSTLKTGEPLGRFAKIMQRQNQRKSPFRWNSTAPQTYYPSPDKISAQSCDTYPYGGKATYEKRNYPTPARDKLNSERKLAGLQVQALDERSRALSTRSNRNYRTLQDQA